MASTGQSPCGRYAPSPTGPLHIGGARTALAAWLSVRTVGGTFLLRMEDLDTRRAVPGAAEDILEDLTWLGIDWDAGPDTDSSYVQSRRKALYEDALACLWKQGRLFPCTHSRKDLRQLATAPHGGPPHPPYPVSLRPRHLAPDWFEHHQDGQASLRFRVSEDPVTFEDRVSGRVCERVSESVGDFVVKRRDGVYAYQLAVVVDDLRMGITEVVRGRDLITSTARQIQLFEALGSSPPAYGHVPLVVAPDGTKLSKRHGSLAIRALRAQGLRAPDLVGCLACSLGLRSEPAPCRAIDLVDEFSWQRVNKDPWVISGGTFARLIVP